MPRRSGSETGAGRRGERRGNASGRRADPKSRRGHAGARPDPSTNAGAERATKADVEANLDEALDATFPASDPVAVAHVD
jgi:hypothetical protein